MQHKIILAGVLFYCLIACGQVEFANPDDLSRGGSEGIQSTKDGLITGGNTQRGFTSSSATSSEDQRAKAFTLTAPTGYWRTDFETTDQDIQIKSFYHFGSNQMTVIKRCQYYGEVDAYLSMVRVPVKIYRKDNQSYLSILGTKKSEVPMNQRLADRDQPYKCVANVNRGVMKISGDEARLSLTADNDILTMSLFRSSESTITARAINLN